MPVRVRGVRGKQKRHQVLPHKNVLSKCAVREGSRDCSSDASKNTRHAVQIVHAASIVQSNRFCQTWLDVHISIKMHAHKSKLQQLEGLSKTTKVCPDDIWYSTVACGMHLQGPIMLPTQPPSPPPPPPRARNNSPNHRERSCDEAN